MFLAWYFVLSPPLFMCRILLDLLVGGIEASLWLGEQFAAGLKLLFPRLNVTVYSSNKLLAFSGLTPRQVRD